MKKSLSLLLIVCSVITGSQSLAAQSEKPVVGKMVYAELGGPSVTMSINYDARFKSGERSGLGYRVGVGYGIEPFEKTLIKILSLSTENIYSIFDDSELKRPFATLPAGLNYTIGKPDKVGAFEIGAGVTLLSRKQSLYNYGLKKPGHIIGHLTFMYRVTPVNSGFSFRVGFTPIIGTAGDLYPMVGFSFGYAF